MIEKVNPKHPDKIADRIAGAIVDLAYRKERNPKIAVEVLIGHHHATIIVESSVKFTFKHVRKIVKRLSGIDGGIELIQAPQDKSLSKNQDGKIRCGDNGIFKGVPLTNEEKAIADIARRIYAKWPSDGKYVLSGEELIICQSNAKTEQIKSVFPKAIVNPLGNWTGGLDVDSGATNRKLGSDMGHSVTGGGLHGKDLSKADVSVNIYAFLKAQATNKPVELYCAIGDEYVDGRPYSEIVGIAADYIRGLGGFEKFAEWGLF